MKLLLVASAGGHLAHLLWLRDWWGEHDRAWVTFDLPDAREALATERVHWAAHPTNRHLGNAVRNLVRARRVITEEWPDVVVTTGAGVAVPFAIAARLAGVPVVFLEVIDRLSRPSLTGRLLGPIADAVVLQWEAQRAHHPDGVVLGPIR